MATLKPGNIIQLRHTRAFIKPRYNCEPETHQTTDEPNADYFAIWNGIFMHEPTVLLYPEKNTWFVNTPLCAVSLEYTDIFGRSGTTPDKLTTNKTIAQREAEHRFATRAAACDPDITRLNCKRTQ